MSRPLRDGPGPRAGAAPAPLSGTRRRRFRRSQLPAMSVAGPRVAAIPGASRLLSSGLAQWRQVLDLSLRDVEPDPVLDRGDGADRDGHLLAAPQVALLEEDVGHLVVGGIHHEPLHLPDLAVDRVHALMAIYLGLPQRDGVLDHQRAPGSLAQPAAGVVPGAGPGVPQHLLGRIEAAELVQRTPQP